MRKSLCVELGEFVMKVHEVLTEGPLSGLAKLGKAAYGAARGKEYRTERDIMANPVVQDAINIWTQRVKQVEYGGVDLTPENYNIHLNKWLGQWLKLKGPYPGTVTDLSKNGVNTYIAKAVAQKLSDSVPASEKAKAAKEKREQAGVKVPDGKRLVVVHPRSGGTYFKTNQSGWTNEMGQPVTSSSSISSLEQLASADPTDTVRIEPIPV